MRSSTSTSTHPPPRSRNTYTTLSAPLLTSTLTLITSLLLLLTLLWHISSTHLANTYAMPIPWQTDFLAQQFKGIKTGYVLMKGGWIPLDCVYAIWSLDYHHGVQRGRNSPLSTPILQTLLDLTLLALLALHIFLTTRSIQTNRAFCHSSQTLRLQGYVFPAVPGQHAHSALGAVQRCERLGVDIWIAGAFSVGMAGFLGGLHCVGLGVRGWGVGVGRDVGGDREVEGGRGSEGGAGEEKGMGMDGGIDAEGGWREVLLECLVP
ncbi:hypothetical protein P153DRAFT_390570 [Dothidotthia symphoricarpi CBS 119687]|uniref:Uncharacterized protein n=1 Tax=Dothidotthia symphoricarpi CBS 119687 TaxID=1392245 RepID=A0A6A6A1D5_9PLEO|nr:uncharacterized protein P153DRAFT_390570 [Dothidotthia symphoricarpi CBS 119687]KAF2124528.1 hypothetical protein P153DRAFT_390570 [Dothidotthia symphoricarpi CBS 119687]